ncbi:MAG: hypothetical protein ACLTQI_08335, partial [Slackia sp.]
SEAASETKKAVEDSPRRSVEREVIREENLTQEDRAVIDWEKRKYPAPTKASDPLGVKIAVKDVIAKRELIEEDDGVTIKGVVERIADPEAAARYSAELSASPLCLCGHGGARVGGICSVRWKRLVMRGRSRSGYR